MIVDDNRDQADSLCILLSLCDENYILRNAYSAEQALQVAADFSPDVVLLDLALPHTNGYTLGKELMEKFPECSVVAVTGLTSAEHIEQSNQSGFKYHLIKPVDTDLLKDIVMQECEAC